MKILQLNKHDKKLRLKIGPGNTGSWVHAELELQYHCLQIEVKIGDYYLRILLEMRDSEGNPNRSRELN